MEDYSEKSLWDGRDDIQVLSDNVGSVDLMQINTDVSIGLIANTAVKYLTNTIMESSPAKKIKNKKIS